jgi:hypothetical protein
MESQKLVVYSCLTGGYDDIRSVVKDIDIDFIMFTDINEDEWPKNTGWTFRKVDESLASTPHLLNRYYKMHPHVVVSEYESSFYIDTNIQILKTDALKTLNKKLTESDSFIAISTHPDRKCIYEECKAVVKFNKIRKADAKKHKEFLIENGYPKNNGLFENNLIWRKSHNKNTILLMKEWWATINKEGLSKRDQLSFVYVLWKLEMKCESLFGEKNCTRNHPDLKIIGGHKVKSNIMTFKDIRKSIIQIRLKKDVKIIRLFGVYLLNKKDIF